MTEALAAEAPFSPESALWILDLAKFASGVNLQGANHVIFLSPHGELYRVHQAMARILRPGQVRTAHFWFLCSDSPTEYWTLRRLISSLTKEVPVGTLDTEQEDVPNDVEVDSSVKTFEELWRKSKNALGWIDPSVEAAPGKIPEENWEYLEKLYQEESVKVLKSSPLPNHIVAAIKAKKGYKKEVVEGNFVFSGKVQEDNYEGIFCRNDISWAVAILRGLSVTRETGTPTYLKCLDFLVVKVQLPMLFELLKQC